MAQVCIYLLGLQSISIACSQGHFQLNANKTFLIFATQKQLLFYQTQLNHSQKIVSQE